MSQLSHFDEQGASRMVDVGEGSHVSTGSRRELRANAAGHAGSNCGSDRCQGRCVRGRAAGGNHGDERTADFPLRDPLGIDARISA